MNVQKSINKLLKAIRLKGIDIKIDRIEFYSDKLEKYCSKHVVYIKEVVENKFGELVGKYIKHDEFFSKVKLLKYLVDKYKEIGSEANGR